MNVFDLIREATEKAPDVVVILTKTAEKYNVRISAELEKDISELGPDSPNFFLFEIDRDTNEVCPEG